MPSLSRMQKRLVERIRIRRRCGWGSMPSCATLLMSVSDLYGARSLMRATCLDAGKDHRSNKYLPDDFGGHACMSRSLTNRAPYGHVVIEATAMRR